MRHFISFQKKKALCLPPGEAQNEPSRRASAHGLNHELMAVGYVLSQEAFAAVESLDDDKLTELYQDLLGGIREVVGGDGYEPIYRNFPQSVLKLSYTDFVVNALLHYWTMGEWRPEDEEHLQREFKLEPANYKPIGLIDETQFAQIFTDLLYSNVSLSAFDKSCIDWYLENGGTFRFSKITFKETAAYVGKRLVESSLARLPLKNATTVLRIWSAYSGGDEGLKENTRFKSPKVRQRAMLMATLEDCNDLEDSFKSHREKWLRLLFFLHPTTPAHRECYPRLADYTERLRNRPQTLRTFNARVEEMISTRNPELFDFLKLRSGVFMRRLDQLVRTFGVEAVERWLQGKLKFEQLVTVYNHFINRGQEQAGRGAVLASQGQSELVTYKALAPLPQELVDHITEAVLSRMRTYRSELVTGTVYVDPGLYHTPLATNNRASSLSLDSKPIGTTEKYTAQETLRLYVHWEGRSDIDLSGFAISRDNQVFKVGWNAGHHAGEYIVYSGDNTGLAEKNAEYLDINTAEIPPEIAWIIVEARIFRGPESFSGYNGGVRMGWMSRKHPTANLHWLPRTLEHSIVLQNKAKTAYLMAYHPASAQIVYLDMSMGSERVSTPQDAIKMRIFLESFVSIEGSGSHEISWSKLNQGHVLHLLAPEVTENQEAADLVFGSETTAEQLSRIMSLAAQEAD